MFLFGGLTYQRIGTALALTDSFKTLHINRVYRQHVALLSFVAPDFNRRHARLIIGYRTQIKTATSAAIFNQLGQGIGETASAHIMNKGNGIVVAQLPALVNNFLTAALNLRVLSLYRGKVQISRAAACGHR